MVGHVLAFQGMVISGLLGSWGASDTVPCSVDAVLRRSISVSKKA